MAIQGVTGEDTGRVIGATPMVQAIRNSSIMLMGVYAKILHGKNTFRGALYCLHEWVYFFHFKAILQKIYYK